MCTPYNGLYGDAPPERGTFFRLERYIERLGSIEKARENCIYKELSKYHEQTQRKQMQCFSCRFMKGVPCSMEGISKGVSFSVKNTKYKTLRVWT